MSAISIRASEILRAKGRARAAVGDEPAATAQDGGPRLPMGILLSGMMKHGGIHTLADGTMMEARIGSMLPMLTASGMELEDAQRHLQRMAARAAAIPTHFFSHLKDRPYRLHARLISYLTFPNRHLRSPVKSMNPGADPSAGAGLTYDTGDRPSPQIPAAFTFVGQFIDHDLTLNAMNLFDDQMQDDVRSEASPLLDLDSVYGARVDDDAVTPRDIPMKDGYFRLRRVAQNGYDVCRRNKGEFGQHCSALIGDKRNDENQIILQIHILLMRLHNAFRGLGASVDEARQQTILHWQSFVFHRYLRLICDPGVVDTVAARLEAGGQDLVHRPGMASCPRATLRMPHEFAIGFRFGHSQLRSTYSLNPNGHFRLFDSLSNGKDDLQGGKCLDAARLIEWPWFLAEQRSNLIDTKVTEVVFDLPESTIPDDIKPVANLPFRNLVRSDSLGLCAGEDLADVYDRCYPGAVPRILQQDVEPDECRRPLFAIGTGGEFRTPLWYYLLREAEVARGGGDTPGHLGPLGSHLVAEVILSAIWYSPVSLLNPASEAVIALPQEFPSPADIDLPGIAEFVRKHDTSPHGCEDDPCTGDRQCSPDDPAICDGA